ncbi:unnamed protein product, partial [marine sediment metagenome]
IKYCRKDQFYKRITLLVRVNIIGDKKIDK